jgi:predicted transcriptional regulator
MNAERFLNAVNEIEQLLREQSGFASGGPIDLISLIDNSPTLTPTLRNKLHKWRQLRNVIVHNPRTWSNPIADPRDSEVIGIEKLLEILRNPPKASEILRLVTPVVLSWDSEISEFFDELMPPKEFSQAPYLDKEKKYQLVTSNAVARWAATNYEKNSGAVIESTIVSEVAQFCEEGDHLVCEKHDVSAQAVIDILTSSSGIPPAAVLLTDTGHTSGKAMGLIVKADLPILYGALSI